MISTYIHNNVVVVDLSKLIPIYTNIVRVPITISGAIDLGGNLFNGLPIVFQTDKRDPYLILQDVRDNNSKPIDWVDDYDSFIKAINEFGSIYVDGTMFNKERINGLSLTQYYSHNLLLEHLIEYADLYINLTENYYSDYVLKDALGISSHVKLISGEDEYTNSFAEYLHKIYDNKGLALGSSDAQLNMVFSKFTEYLVTTIPGILNGLVEFTYKGGRIGIKIFENSCAIRYRLNTAIVEGEVKGG